MSNLLHEYRKRHKIDAISVTNESFCYFGVDGVPTMALVVSSQPKSLNYCSDCGDTSNLIVEKLQFHQQKDLIRIVSHQHISPNGDLRSLVPPKIAPIAISCSAEIETLLWKMFVSQMGSTPELPPSNSPEPLLTYEAMAWHAMYLSGRFNIYYDSFQKITAGRKYLLYS